MYLHIYIHIYYYTYIYILLLYILLIHIDIFKLIYIYAYITNTHTHIYKYIYVYRYIYIYIYIIKLCWFIYICTMHVYKCTVYDMATKQTCFDNGRAPYPPEDSPGPQYLEHDIHTGNGNL